VTATRQERSPQATKRLARLTGALYVSLAVATLFGYYHAPLVLDDLNAIARTITAPDLRFRIGVMSDVLSMVLAVPFTLMLYQLLKPVNETLAALTALLQLVAIPVTLVVALNYVAAQTLLTNVPDLSAFTDAQREALGMLFLRIHAHGVLAEEIFWGLWLFPFGLLVIRSQFLPRVLGILLIIAGVGYAAHSITSLLLGGQRIELYERLTMLARAGELPVMLWLLIKGADSRRAASRAA